MQRNPTNLVGIFCQASNLLMPVGIELRIAQPETQLYDLVLEASQITMLPFHLSA